MDGHNGKYERLLSLQAEVTQAYRDLGITGEPEPQSLVSHPVETFYQPVPGIDCHCPCDFRNLPVKAGTVDAVITDLPYVTEWLPNVPEFSEWCARVLKPEGVLVTFYGQAHLDKCMAALGTHLNYQWQFISPLVGTNKVLGFPLQSRYQLALVYSRARSLGKRRVVDDWIPAGRRMKGLHPHQKNPAQMQTLVEAFSRENDLICDPCACTFVTAEACWHANRKFIGGDLDPECLEMARQRFANLLTN